MRLIGGILAALLIAAPMMAVAGPVTIVDGSGVEKGTAGNPLIVDAGTITFDGQVTAVPGAYADGSIVTLGTEADAACSTDIATCTLIALVKRNNQDTSAALAAGSAIIGKVGIDQTTPGATNNVTISTNVGTLPLIQATASAAVTTASAAALQVIAASGSTVIRVTHWDLTTTLANNVTWESADTGGSCANPVALTGAMPFAANGGASAGSGLGAILILPSGKALCMLTSAATQISGAVAYAQF